MEGYGRVPGGSWGGSGRGLEEQFDLGGLLELSWAPLGNVLGPSWDHLGPSWGSLNASSDRYVPSWRLLGAILSRLGGPGRPPNVPKTAQHDLKTRWWPMLKFKEKP